MAALRIRKLDNEHITFIPYKGHRNESFEDALFRMAKVKKSIPQVSQGEISKDNGCSNCTDKTCCKDCTAKIEANRKSLSIIKQPSLLSLIDKIHNNLQHCCIGYIYNGCIDIEDENKIVNAISNHLGLTKTYTIFKCSPIELDLEFTKKLEEQEYAKIYDVDTWMVGDVIVSIVNELDLD